MRNWPKRLGKSASATLLNSKAGGMGGGTTNNFIIMNAGMPAQQPAIEQLLVILLVKLAVAASLASILTRSQRFQRMLMREERTLAQRVQMAVVCAAIFGSGVLARVLTNDAYLDLGLEGSLV